MLDIYVCEDNNKQRDFVTRFISDYCVINGLDASLVLSEASPTKILQHYTETVNPALFFLDIDLKTDMNGIELASQIRETGRKVFIVFLTSHPEMTFLIFRHKIEALDFIIKDNLSSMKGKIGECIDVAIKRHLEGSKSKIINFYVNDKTHFLDVDDIICIETTPIKHKLRLYTANRVLEFSAELKKMEEQLGNQFIRCHRSCLINRNQIKIIDQKENTILMSNGIVYPLSRNGKRNIH